MKNRAGLDEAIKAELAKKLAALGEGVAEHEHTELVKKRATKYAWAPALPSPLATFWSLVKHRDFLPISL